MSLQSSAAARLASGLSVLKGLGVTDRDTHLRVLRETLDNHPHYFGVWAVWEPDALDGNDAAFGNTPGHDATGRFKPSWHRRSGEPRFEIHARCEKQEGCFQELMVKRRSALIFPNEASTSGAYAPMASVAAPIMQGQQCLGIAGVNFSLGQLAMNLMAGKFQETLKHVQRMGEELEAGLVFLDHRQRVVAYSDAVPSIVNGFTSRPVETAHLWPEDLSFSDADTRDGSAERTMQHHGVTLKAVRSPQWRDRLSVVVLTRSVPPPDLPPLSSREDEVMQWLSEGKSNEEIGIILSISPHTVKNHLDRIYRKIGVANRHAATLAWSQYKALSGMIPCT